MSIVFSLVAFLVVLVAFAFGSRRASAADYQVSYGQVDARDDKAWAGFVIKNVTTPPTGAQLTALWAEIDAACDGQIYNVKTTTTTKTAYDVTTLGESYVEYTGKLVFENILTGAEHTILLHSIADAEVTKPFKSGKGGVVPYVNLTRVEDIKAAFAACLGTTSGNLIVKENSVYQSQR